MSDKIKEVIQKLPELPPVKDDEIRITLSGGVVQGFIAGKGVDMSKISLTLADYDQEGVDSSDIDNSEAFHCDSENDLVEYRAI